MIDRTNNDGYSRSVSRQGTVEPSRAPVPRAVPVIYVSEEFQTPVEGGLAGPGPLAFATRLLHTMADYVDDLRHNLEQLADCRRC